MKVKMAYEKRSVEEIWIVRYVLESVLKSLDDAGDGASKYIWVRGCWVISVPSPQQLISEVLVPYFYAYEPFSSNSIGKT